MKKLGARFYLIASSIIWTVITVLRFILELVGYATITDDAKQAHGLLKVLADMAIALPWWAIRWPLIATYVFAAGVAFDFSFDLFKREKKPKGKAGKYISRIDSFYDSINKHRSKQSGRIVVTSYAAVAAEIEMIWEYLHNEGFELPDIPEFDETQHTFSDFLNFVKAELKQIRAYLVRGEIEKAKKPE